MRTLPQTLIVLALAIAPGLSSAECDNPPPPPPPPHGDMKGPPPRPFVDPTLCKDKKAGETVEMKTPDGRSIKGTCLLVFLPEPPDKDHKEGKTK